MRTIMIKRALAYILSALMVISFAPAAFAAEDPVLDRDSISFIQTQENVIRVTGSVENAKASGTNIFGYVFTSSALSDISQIVALDTAAVYADGDGTFTLDIHMNDELETGRYTVNVTARQSVAKASFTVDYIAKSERDAFVEVLNLPDATAQSVVELLDSTTRILDIDQQKSAIYSQMSSAAKLKMAEYLINRNNGTAPATLMFSDVNDLVIDALILTAFNCSDNTAASVANIIYEYADRIGVDVTQAPLSGVSKTELFGEAVLRQDSTEDPLEMAQTVLTCAYLTLINQVNWLGIVEVVSANNDFFQMDESEIKKINSKQSILRTFCEEMKNAYYTVDSFRSAWDDAYDEAVKSASKSSGSGGSGSSTKAKDSYGDTSQVYIASNNTTTDVLGKTKTISDYYDDMTGYEWASNSVLTLTEADILSGTGEKKFEPGRYLKREEFMKLIINTFGMADITATSTFSDVESGAWYYIFVASAQQRGITEGRGGGVFGVGDYVTREEMMTIAYRAAKMAGYAFPSTNATVPFTDADDIASYALEAVSALYYGGIVSGMGTENKIAPKAFTSRAEAAVVIAKLYAMRNK